MTYTPELDWKKSLFTSLDIPILTLQAVDVTSSGMKLLGEVLFLPDPETEVLCYFNYREVGSGTWISTTKQGVVEPGLVEQEISGLTPNTEYEYYIVMEDTSEELLEEGEILSSTTQVLAVFSGFVSTPNFFGSDVSIDLVANSKPGNLSVELFVDGSWVVQDSKAVTVNDTYLFELSDLSVDTGYNVRFVYSDGVHSLTSESFGFSTLPGQRWIFNYGNNTVTSGFPQQLVSKPVYKGLVPVSRVRINVTNPLNDFLEDVDIYVGDYGSWTKVEPVEVSGDSDFVVIPSTSTLRYKLVSSESKVYPMFNEFGRSCLIRVQYL